MDAAKVALASVSLAALASRVRPEPATTDDPRSGSAAGRPAARSRSGRRKGAGRRAEPSGLSRRARPSGSGPRGRALATAGGVPAGERARMRPRRPSFRHGLGYVCSTWTGGWPPVVRGGASAI